MSLVQRVRAAGTRRAGLALGGLLTAGLVAATGSALASPGTAASPSVMAGMSSSSTHGGSGFTNGWYDGHTVRFYYTKNYFCRKPPHNGARSRCEAGVNYTQTRRTASTRCT